MKETTKLKDQALLEINSAPDLKHLEQIRVNYLGKKGKLTEQLKTLGKLPAEERPKAGQVINDVKILIQNALEQAFLDISSSYVPLHQSFLIFILS